MPASSRRNPLGEAAAPVELAACLRAIAAGDRSAFRALYDATSARLYGAALKVLRRPDAAADVVQETYLRIWSRSAGFDPDRGEAMAWISGILRHAAYDRLARDRRVHDDVDALAETLEAPPEPGLPLDVVRGLARLAPAQRDALVLTLIEGRTDRAVAQHLGVPLGTAKSLIRRGVRRLRLELAS